MSASAVRRCSSCGGDRHNARTCPDASQRPHQGGIIRNDLTYREDYVARVFVRLNPNGATLEVVGAMFDLTRERIRQIEARAIKKLKDACRLEGLTLGDFLKMHGANLGYAKMEIWMD